MVFFPLTYLEYAVETLTVTILKHVGKAEIKVPVIIKMADQLVADISGFTAIGVP